MTIFLEVVCLLSSRYSHEGNFFNPFLLLATAVEYSRQIKVVGKKTRKHICKKMHLY